MMGVPTKAEKEVLRALRDLILTEVAECSRIVSGIDCSGRAAAEYIEGALRRTFADLLGRH